MVSTGVSMVPRTMFRLKQRQSFWMIENHEVLRRGGEVFEKKIFPYKNQAWRGEVTTSFYESLRGGLKIF